VSFSGEKVRHKNVFLTLYNWFKFTLGVSGRLSEAFAVIIGGERQEADDAADGRSRLPDADVGDETILSGVEAAKGEYGGGSHYLRTKTNLTLKSEAEII